jgi:hypothetical protein
MLPNPFVPSAELFGSHLPVICHHHSCDVSCFVLDVPRSSQGLTLCSTALPSTALLGNTREAPTEAATELRCSWIMMTQLRGEIHCSLRGGHGGEHCFTVDQEPG